MSIARIPGYSLVGNLDRQGLDLYFTTNSQSLVYMDFANFRLGVNTAAPSQPLDVNGNILATAGNLLTSGNLAYDIGTVTNQWRTIYANSISGTNLIGTLQTSNQPNITSLGALSALSIDGNLTVQTNILPTGNVSGNIGYSNLWWKSLYVSTINSASINGTILTATQPYISNLGNITVDSISIGGNISITGNVNGTDIVANTITANLIYGTINTAIQPYISNLGNITADSITINSNLRIDGTTTANVVNANTISEGGYRVITSNTTVNVTGDVTGTGNVSNVPLTLVNTAVTSGTYGSTTEVVTFAVDSKGRITNIANVTLTQVGNVTFSNTTISTTANLTLTPANSYIFAGNSIISNVANPVSQQDVVTLNYLTTAIAAAATSLTNGDSLLSLIDSAASRLELTLDSQLIANITANTSTFYNTVNIGNISINGDTISSQGNIYLNAQNTGIVHIVGTDALSIPAGNSSARPLNPELGYIRFNTDTETLEYWTGTEWTYPGAATITSETITPDGVSASYVLSEESTPDGLIVSINGTLQQPFTSYIMTGNLITFIETPQNTDIIEVRSIAAGAVSISSLTYGPTSKVELSTGNINITGNLLPTANVAYDLGSDSLWWRDMYLSGNTIHLGGAQLKVVDNALSFTPAGSPTPINLSTDIDPSLLYSANSNVTVTANFVNVAINSSTVASFNINGISTTANIAAAYIIGDGSQLTGLPAGYANTNVAAYLPDYNGAIGSLTTANTAMKGYVDGQITSLINGAPSTLDTLNEIANALGTDANLSVTLTSLIANVQSNVSTSNTAMKGYVDGQITTVGNSVTSANTAMKGYVDGQITTVGNSVTSANTAMKGYVDAINSTLTANAGAQAGTLSTIQSTYAQLAGATFTGAVVAPNITLTAALPITSGGTGGTSASEALNNLFPSGETSGYVLKTSGPGSYYWGAETGSGGTIGTTISTSRTYKTATAGQTVFTGLGTYTPGAGQLRIYLNGVRQFDSAYTETNSSAVTLSSGVSSGTILLAEVDGYTDFTSYASDVVFSNVGGIAATNVQDALAELDTEKAALSGATFTGNITAGNVTTTNLTGTIRTAAQTSITQVGTLSNLTVSGNIAAHTTTSNLKAYGEIVSNVGGVSGTANIDLSTSNIFDITLTNSTTFTFINHPPAGVTRPVTIVLRQPAAGGKTASFTGALYTDGTAPVLSTNNNAIDVLSFWSINGGTTFFGTFAMANVS